MKYAVDQQYFDNGKVWIVGPFECPDDTKEIQGVHRDRFTHYVDVFDSREDAQEFIDTELTEV